MQESPRLDPDTKLRGIRHHQSLNLLAAPLVVEVMRTPILNIGQQHCAAKAAVPI